MRPSAKQLDLAQRWLVKQEIDTLTQDLQRLPQQDHLVASVQLHMDRVFRYLSKAGPRQEGWNGGCCAKVQFEPGFDVDVAVGELRKVLTAFGDSPFVQQLVFSYLFLSLAAVRGLPEAVTDDFALPSTWQLHADTFCHLVSSLEFHEYLLDSFLWLPVKSPEQLTQLVLTIVPPHQPLALELLSSLPLRPSNTTPALSPLLTIFTPGALGLARSERERSSMERETKVMGSLLACLSQLHSDCSLAIILSFVLQMGTMDARKATATNTSATEVKHGTAGPAVTAANERKSGTAAAAEAKNGTAAVAEQTTATEPIEAATDAGEKTTPTAKEKFVHDINEPKAQHGFFGLDLMHPLVGALLTLWLKAVTELESKWERHRPELKHESKPTERAPTVRELTDSAPTQGEPQDRAPTKRVPTGREVRERELTTMGAITRDSKPSETQAHHMGELHHGRELRERNQWSHAGGGNSEEEPDCERDWSLERQLGALSRLRCLIVVSEAIVRGSLACGGHGDRQQLLSRLQTCMSLLEVLLCQWRDPLLSCLVPRTREGDTHHASATLQQREGDLHVVVGQAAGKGESQLPFAAGHERQAESLLVPVADNEGEGAFHKDRDQESELVSSAHYLHVLLHVLASVLSRCVERATVAPELSQNVDTAADEILSGSVDGCSNQGMNETMHWQEHPSVVQRVDESMDEGLDMPFHVLSLWSRGTGLAAGQGSHSAAGGKPAGSCTLGSPQFHLLCQVNAQVQLMCLRLKEALGKRAEPARRGSDDVVAGVSVDAAQAQTAQPGKHGQYGQHRQHGGGEYTDPFRALISSVMWVQILQPSVSAAAGAMPHGLHAFGNNAPTPCTPHDATPPHMNFPRITAPKVAPPHSIPHSMQYLLAMAAAWLSPGMPCWSQLLLGADFGLLQAASCSFLAPELVTGMAMGMLERAVDMWRMYFPIGAAVYWLVQLVADAATLVQSPTAQVALLRAALGSPCFRRARVLVERDPVIATSAQKALIAISNQMVDQEEFAGQVALSQADEVQQLAEAARKLLPFALLTPSLFLEHMVTVGIHHPAQQQLVIQLFSTLRPITSWKGHDHPSKQQSSSIFESDSVSIPEFNSQYGHAPQLSCPTPSFSYQPPRMLKLLRQHLLPESVGFHAIPVAHSISGAHSTSAIVTAKASAACEKFVQGLMEAKLLFPFEVVQSVIQPAMWALTKDPDPLLVETVLKLLVKLLEAELGQAQCWSPASAMPLLRDACLLTQVLMEEGLRHGHLQWVNLQLARRCVQQLVGFLEARLSLSGQEAISPGVASLLEGMPWPIALLLLPLLMLDSPEQAWEERARLLMQKHVPPQEYMSVASENSLVHMAAADKRSFRCMAVADTPCAFTMHCLTKLMWLLMHFWMVGERHSQCLLDSMHAAWEGGSQCTGVHSLLMEMGEASAKPPGEDRASMNGTTQAANGNESVTWSAQLLLGRLEVEVAHAGMTCSKAAMLAALSQVLPFATDEQLRMSVEQGLPWTMWWLERTAHAGEPLAVHAEETHAVHAEEGHAGHNLPLLQRCLDACCTATLLFLQHSPWCQSHPYSLQPAADRCMRQVASFTSHWLQLLAAKPQQLLAFIRAAVSRVVHLLGVMEQLELNCSSLLNLLLVLVPEAFKALQQSTLGAAATPDPVALATPERQHVAAEERPSAQQGPDAVLPHPGSNSKVQVVLSHTPHSGNVRMAISDTPHSSNTQLACADTPHSSNAQLALSDTPPRSPPIGPVRPQPSPSAEAAVALGWELWLQLRVLSERPRDALRSVLLLAMEEGGPVGTGPVMTGSMEELFVY